MKHKVQVIMLPTKNQTYQVTQNNYFINDSSKYNWGKLEALKCERVTSNGHAWNGSGIQTYINHLYITVSQDVEPVKEGDWCINLAHKKLVQPTDTEWARSNADNLKKVIATTDSKLVYNHKELHEVQSISMESSYHKRLPQLPKSFLKEYVVNPDSEYEVEYNIECILEKENCDKCYLTEQPCNDCSITIKLNSDNTININLVEKKVYSREEVKKLIELYQDTFGANGSASTFCQKWIKEHL